MVLAIAFMFTCCLALVPFVAMALFLALDGDARRGRGELLWAGGIPTPEYLAQEAARRGEPAATLPARDGAARTDDAFAAA